MDARYNVSLKVGESIADMRKRVMFQIEQDKLTDQLKKQVALRKGSKNGQSRANAVDVVSATGSTKTMKIVQVMRAGIIRPSSLLNNNQQTQELLEQAMAKNSLMSSLALNSSQKFTNEDLAQHSPETRTLKQQDDSIVEQRSPSVAIDQVDEISNFESQIVSAASQHEAVLRN